MTRAMAMVGVLGLASVASAAIEARRYVPLGDVAYWPQEGTSSCGKAARDLLKTAVKGIRVVTVSARHMQVNTGERWEIGQRTETSLMAYKEQKDPVPGYPNRVTTFATMLVRNGDDYRFSFVRIAASGSESCSDAYVVTVE